jgi:zinc protease
MAMLSDLLFPDPTTREYVTDELGGRLDVSTSYDAIDVTLVGKSSSFERMVEILRTAIVTTPLDADVITRVRASRQQIAKESGALPATIADRAIAARLFGSFPYGHPVGGTPESLARVNRGDLIQARDRFLNPNNATLIVAGNIDPDRTMRALRQLLGGWRKSEVIVPQTFRQPSAPDPRTLVIESTNGSNVDLRYASRSVARSDKDYYAAQILAGIVRERLNATELGKERTFVRLDAFNLPGMFVIGTSVPAADAGKTLALLRGVSSSLAKTQPSVTEIEKARADSVAGLRAQTEKSDGIMEFWLDRVTYKTPAFDSQVSSLNAVTGQDIQRLASRLFAEPQIATVAVGHAEEVAKLLGPEKVDRLSSPPAATPSTAKPSPRR